MVAKNLKNCFTAYGPAELNMTTQVPEFPTMDAWNSQIAKINETKNLTGKSGHTDLVYQKGTAQTPYVQY